VVTLAFLKILGLVLTWKSGLKVPFLALGRSYPLQIFCCVIWSGVSDNSCAIGKSYTCFTTGAVKDKKEDDGKVRIKYKCVVMLGFFLKNLTVNCENNDGRKVAVKMVLSERNGTDNSPQVLSYDNLLYTDKKKKIKFSSYIRKFKRERLQSHL
jgi:hypothetical protein